VEHEVIGEGVFQKTGKVNEEKQQDIITYDLQMKQAAQFGSGEVFLLYGSIIDRKASIKEDEECCQKIEYRKREREIEKKMDHGERAEDPQTGDPPKCDKPRYYIIQVGIFS